MNKYDKMCEIRKKKAFYSTNDQKRNSRPPFALRWYTVAFAKDKEDSLLSSINTCMFFLFMVILWYHKFARSAIRLRRKPQNDVDRKRSNDVVSCGHKHRQKYRDGDCRPGIFGIIVRNSTMAKMIKNRWFCAVSVSQKLYRS